MGRTKDALSQTKAVGSLGGPFRPAFPLIARYLYPSTEGVLNMRHRELDVQRPVHGTLADHSALDRKLLFVGANPEDHRSLRRILHDPEWRMISAFSCQQAIAYLCRDRMGVIVCDRHLPDGTWIDILSYIAELTDRSDVIVVSSTTDSHFRAEVRGLGGFEVLSKPFLPEEVRRIVLEAWENKMADHELAPL